MVSVLLPSQSFKHSHDAASQPVSTVDSFNAAGDTQPTAAPAAVPAAEDDGFGEAAEDTFDEDDFGEGDFDEGDFDEGAFEEDFDEPEEAPAQSSVG